jgi:translocator protein
VLFLSRVRGIFHERSIAVFRINKAKFCSAELGFCSCLDGAICFFIAVSFLALFYKAYQKHVPAKLVLPFALNLIFNFSFTPIQFGLKNNFLASIDIIFVWLTLSWALLAVWKHVRWVTLINLPYFFWCCFATFLQLTITVLNWK